MKAMILAAGRGKRMGALTDDCPKPLIKVMGLSLIEHHIIALKAQGFNELVINVAYLGEQIKQQLGSGEKWGVSIDYSDEGTHALETGGGIVNALPLLGPEPFLVVNADVWTDFPYASLRQKTPTTKMHLVLVENPVHHPDGDFYLSEDKLVAMGEKKFTYGGLGVFDPSVFKGEKTTAFPLAPVIRELILAGEVSGQLYSGVWVDVGTPERLAQLTASQ